MKRYFLFFLLAFITFNSNAQDGFQSLNGPKNSDAVMKLAVSSNGKLWIATANGLYYSIDNGTTKTRVLNSIEFCSGVYANKDTIALIHNKLIQQPQFNYQYFEEQLSVSYDNGATWQNPIVLGQNGNVRYLGLIGKYFYYRIPYPNSSSIYVVDVQSLTTSIEFKSPGYLPISMYSNSNFVVVNTVDTMFSGGGGGLGSSRIYTSLDWGQTWNLLNLPSTYSGSLNILGDSSFIIYGAGSSSGTNYITHDRGLTLSPYYSSSPDRIYTSALVNDTILAVKYGANGLVKDTVYFSDNNGVTYSSVYNPALTALVTINNEVCINNTTNIFGFGPLDAQWMFGIKKLPLSRYSLFDTSTVTINNDLVCSAVSGLVSTDSFLYAATSEALYISNDSGNSWLDITPQDTFSSNSTYVFADGNTVIVTGLSTRISYDNGLTWNPLNGYLQLSEPMKKFAIYYFNSGLWSTDNWFTANSSNYNGSPISANSMNIFDSTDIYAEIGDTSNNFKMKMLKFDTTTKQWSFYQNLTHNGEQTNWASQTIATAQHFDSIYISHGVVFDSVSQPHGLSYSYNGYDWFYADDTEIRKYYGLQYFQNEYYTKPIFYNNVFISTLAGKGIVFSTNGITWHATKYKLDVPNGFSTSIYGNLHLHKNKLYLGTAGKGILKFKDNFTLVDGNVFKDLNGNGIKDANENGIANCPIITTDFETRTEQNGKYYYLLNLPQDTIKPKLSHFTTSPTSRIVTSATASNNNFAITNSVPVHDLGVDAVGIVKKPGAKTKFNIEVKNYGDTLYNDTLNVLLDTIYSNVTFNVAPNVNANNVLKWSISNLNILASLNLQIEAVVSTSAMLGTVTKSYFSLSSSLADLDTTNNYIEDIDSIKASYDPNEKICQQGSNFNVLYQMNGEVVYEIHFQNEGNIATEFVRLVDTLSDYFDLATLRVINSSSDSMRIQRDGQRVQFIFDPLHLEPKSVNELASIGFVKYGIKVKPGFKVGDELKNTAYIYFDYNSAIITNTTNTIGVNYPLSINTNISGANLFTLSPNPTHSSVQINGINSNELFDVEVYGLQGQLLLRKANQNNGSTISLESLNDGLYFVKVKSRKGTQGFSLRKQ
jgi:Secretion system C-terminal sorting domain